MARKRVVVYIEKGQVNKCFGYKCSEIKKVFRMKSHQICIQPILNICYVLRIEALS